MAKASGSAATNSYYGLPTIKADIFKLAGNPPEAAVRTIWLAILAYTFRVTSAYSHSYENDATGGVLVVKHRQQKLLVVKCKSAQYGTQPEKWTAAAEQLPQNLRGSSKVYGAVAIGKKVRFYEYDGRKESFVGLKGHEKEYDLATGCEVVQRVLDGMKHCDR